MAEQHQATVILGLVECHPFSVVVVGLVVLMYPLNPEQ
jgi:hypothetical protein